MVKAFNLTINVENDNFRTDGAPSTVGSAAPEISRLLRQLADKVEPGITLSFCLSDLNGNTVGVAGYELETEVTHEVAHA